MNILIYIAIILTIIYIIYSTIKFNELPKSISAMCRAFKSSSVWTCYMFIIAFCLGIPFFEILPDHFKILGALFIANTCWVGIYPLMFDEDIFEHYFFGITACIISQVIVFISNPWLLILWTILIPLFFIKYIRNRKLLFIEIMCALTSCLCVLGRNLW